jgi:hypothetical protein
MMTEKYSDNGIDPQARSVTNSATFCLCVMLIPILFILKPLKTVLNQLILASILAPSTTIISILMVNAVNAALVIMFLLNWQAYYRSKLTSAMLLLSMIVTVAITLQRIGAYIWDALPIFLIYGFLYFYTVYKRRHNKNH